jgi:hypothetical protein
MEGKNYDVGWNFNDFTSRMNGLNSYIAVNMTPIQGEQK